MNSVTYEDLPVVYTDSQRETGEISDRTFEKIMEGEYEQQSETV